MRKHVIGLLQSYFLEYETYVMPNIICLIKCVIVLFQVGTCFSHKNKCTDYRRE